MKAKKATGGGFEARAANSLATSTMSAAHGVGSRFGQLCAVTRLLLHECYEVLPGDSLSVLVSRLSLAPHEAGLCYNDITQVLLAIRCQNLQLDASVLDLHCESELLNRNLHFIPLGSASLHCGRRFNYPTLRFKWSRSASRIRSALGVIALPFRGFLTRACCCQRKPPCRTNGRRSGSGTILVERLGGPQAAAFEYGIVRPASVCGQLGSARRRNFRAP